MQANIDQQYYQIDKSQQENDINQQLQIEQQLELEEDFILSGQCFEDQFNPKSKNYHNGLQMLVPLGGKNIPESMPYEFDPSYFQQQLNFEEILLQKNEHLNFLVDLRQRLLQIKLNLAKISQCQEAMLRHKDVFQLKGNEKNSKHIEIFKSKIKTQQDLILQCTKFIQNCIEYFEKVQLHKINKEFNNKFIISLQKLIQEIISKEIKNKVQLTELGFQIKNLSADAFLEANKILDEIKKIKQEFNKGNQEYEVLQQQTEKQVLISNDS